MRGGKAVGAGIKVEVHGAPVISRDTRDGEISGWRTVKEQGL